MEQFLLSGVAKCFEMWWPGTELNRRRQPFQGCALPPELPGHIYALDFAGSFIVGRAGLRSGERQMRLEKRAFSRDDYNNPVEFTQSQTCASSVFHLRRPQR